LERLPRHGPLLTGLVTLAVFWPCLQNGFVHWDDGANFLDNPAYRGFSWPQLRWMFTSFHLGHYIPLTWMSFSLDHTLWGMNPAGYHLTNVLLHAANAVLFYFLAERLFRLSPGRPPAETAGAVAAASLAAALFFSLHPLRVESVAWVTGRKDLLAGFFILLSSLLYLRHASRGTAGRYIACLGLFLFALLSKGVSLVLPFVWLALDFFPLRRLTDGPSLRRCLKEKIPFLALSTVFAAVALAGARFSGAAMPLTEYDPQQRLGEFFFSSLFYLHKTLLPFSLSPLYPLADDLRLNVSSALLHGLVFALLTVLAFLYRKKAPAGIALWTVYLAFLAPTSGLIQSGPQTVADRYSYLSCFGWALLAGGAVRARFPQGRGRRILALLPALGLFSLLSVLSHKQIGVWKDSQTLWSHVLTVTPPSSIAHLGYGMALEETGEVDRAEEHYRKALALRPTFDLALRRLAGLRLRKGEWRQAAGLYQLSLAFQPNDAEALNNLGYSLLRLHMPVEAAACLSRALALMPDSEKIKHNLHLAHAAGRRPAEKR